MIYNLNRRKVSLWEKFVSLSMVWILIIITSIISIISLFLFSFVPESINYLALKPDNILSGKYLWTLLSHIFVHGGIFHLFVNMFTLFFIGLFCEKIIGKKRFLWFYLISGILAGMLFVGLAYLGSSVGFEKVLGSVEISGVGASGALFGLIGLLAVLLPNKKVVLIAGPLILLIIQVIATPFILESFQGIFAIVINVLILFSILGLFMRGSFFEKFTLPITMSLWVAPIIAIVPLTIISIFVSLPIANTAHFGGLVIGLIYGFYLRNKYKRKVALLGRYFG